MINKQFKKIAFTLVITSLAFIPLKAQKVFSLKKCYDLATQNNIQYQQLKLSQESANLDLKQSKDNLLPNVNSNLNYAFNLGRSIDPTSNSFTTQGINTIGLGVNAGVGLFQGFTRLNQIESNKLGQQATKLDAETFYQTLQLSIFSAYLEILKAEEQLIILNEQNQLSELQKVQTEKLINAGVLPKGEIYNIQAQLAGNTSQIVIAKNLIDLAYLNLSQLMNYENSDFKIENIEIPKIVDQIQLKNAKSIYENAITLRPDIQAGDLRLGIADYGRKIAEGARYPTLSFFTGINTNYASFKIPTSFELGDSDQFTPYYTYDQSGLPSPVYTVQTIPTNFKRTPFFTQFGDNISWNFGLALNIPIFNQFSIKNNIERTKIGIKAQELSNKQLKNDLFKTIQQAYNTSQSNYLTYQASIANIDALEKNLAIIKKKYDYGTATSLELNSASNALTVAKLNLNNTKYDYIFSVKILEFYEGKPLSL